MHPTSRAARIAGATYLLLLPVAPFAMFYVPGRLVVAGDAAATAQRVLAGESLFRAGMIAHVASGLVFLLVVILLRRLLAGAGRTLADAMLILAGISVALSFANLLNQEAALMLFREEGLLPGLSRQALDGLGLFFLRLNGAGNLINQLFWGLWLFPFGALVMRSGFLPRALGVLLLVNGAAYVALALIFLAAPQHSRLAARWAFPALLGELWIMLWLIVRGVSAAALERVTDQLPGSH